MSNRSHLRSELVLSWAARSARSISKADVIMLTQVAALALAERNIRGNCVMLRANGPDLSFRRRPPSETGTQ